MKDMLVIAGREFTSRLFVGTGKFSSNRIMQEAVLASGSQMVTAALRRIDFDRPEEDLLSALQGHDFLLLPNTSGARNAEEAIRLARLSRAAGMEPWLKLEVIPDSNHLLPDPIETLKAATQLVKEGFTVLPYMQADPVLAKHLAEAGCAAVMPLGSPIGTNRGVRTEDLIKLIIADSQVPVVVDAGLGAPSHAAFAMELGADAVLINTAIAVARNPVAMANAFKLAVEAGRIAFLSGCILIMYAY
jgi:thiazole synthase